MDRDNRVETLSEAQCLSLLGTVPVGRVVFTEHALPAVLPTAPPLTGDRRVGILSGVQPGAPPQEHVVTTFASLADLTAAVGTELGTSEWHTIEQERVNLFAEATEDHQWIHVDPERAKDSPFGTTIAHGYLTLSLIPVLAKECYGVEGIRMALNYGSEKVRFPAPVPVGTAIRATAVLLSVEDVPGGVQALVRYTISSETSAKPHCVAETITRFYAA